MKPDAFQLFEPAKTLHLRLGDRLAPAVQHLDDGAEVVDPKPLHQPPRRLRLGLRVAPAARELLPVVDDRPASLLDRLDGLALDPRPADDPAEHHGQHQHEQHRAPEAQPEQAPAWLRFGFRAGRIRHLSGPRR